MSASHPTPPTAPREGLRQAMSWLHTWAGLVLGWLMFAIFLTGTLALFKEELNQWTHPELHGLPAPGTYSQEQAAQRALDTLQRQHPDATRWFMHLPDARNPSVNLGWNGGDGRFHTMQLHPVTGAVLPVRESMGGNFFYRFHFELRSAQKSRWIIEGRWVVGAATLTMFIALLSGIITHRRIFKDFFTYRPGKGGQRAWLDAHNVSGVLVLPFYLMITFSGLMIFHNLYLPAGINAAYQGAQGVDRNAYFADLQGIQPTPRTPGKKPEPLPAIALHPIFSAAGARWGDGHIARLQGRHDAQGRTVVQVARPDGERLQQQPPRLVFDATTGQLLASADPQGLAVKTYGVLMGLHYAHFAGPGMRWVLFGFGLLGCLMIATGLVLWSVKRSAQSARRKGGAAPTPPFGERLVSAMNIAALAGLPLACGVYLAANRLLPLDMAGRADTEIACFYGAWGAALVWALYSAVLRPHGLRWSMVFGAGALVWLALPLLNACTSDAHLGATLAAGDWLWAGMDMSFVCAGMLLGWLGWRLRPRRATGPAHRAQTRPQARTATPAPEDAPHASALRG